MSQDRSSQLARRVATILVLMVIDHPPAWPESSCTGMFTFAIANGVEKGWLDPADYTQSARNAWIALCGYLNDDGDITEVCRGTNKSDDIDYYLARPRPVGDYHGQAGMIWAAWTLLE